jgi:serine/threonine protein kinase/tetratricopeptide (TPR) repeat protein
MLSTDRNLLFGILALQMDFITRDALIAAMYTWVQNKAKPLGQILVEQGHLNPQHLALLEPLVQAHIEAHNNDPQQSLASLSSVSSVRDQLAAISDDQLQQSLLGVESEAELSATRQARIDAIYDRFEAAWRAAASSGERPRIEDFVGDPAAPDHAILLCELVALDFVYRRLAGETPSVDEYAARFPDLDAARLARMLGRQTSGEPGSTTDERPSRNGSGLRYRILRPHARGGLGEVFVALDQELNREVDLKEIKEERAHDTVSRSRFLLEAEITGGLEHPGIVPVYGLGQYADGRPFYAMRFIKGDNLKEAIRRFHQAEKLGRDSGERSLALRDLLRRFVDVCNAVAYAHSRGVLHRDLKPGNIMLGKYGETLIVDWGLAKSVGRSEQTRTTEESTLQPSSGSDWAATVMGTVIGTPAFMSPEQAAGRLDLLGIASDIYSLGATLYALLTGTAPFDESDKVELLQQVQHGAWRPPRQVKADTPAALDAICRKAMALEPKDRYVTALGLAADVEHWLADEPVPAYREPWAVRTGRWLRRHRVLVTGLAVALLVGLVGLAGGLVFVTSLNRQLESANAELAAANTNERQAREQAEKVLEFVEKRVFAAARPEGQEGGLGHAVTLRRAIESALPFVAKSFTDQPLIEARLRVTLGISFSYLGEPKIAAEQYEASRALCSQHLGPDHPDTLASMNDLASSYFYLGRTTEALKLREEALRLCKAKLGPDHPLTLGSMTNLANSYTALGRHGDALKLRQETLALKKAKLGLDHPSTLGSMNNLALSYFDLTQYDDAFRLHRQTLALRKALIGPDHPETLESMTNLAITYSILGRHANAMKLNEETLALRKAKLGRSHPDTLGSMHNLANNYADLGRHADALKLREETLALQKAKLGPDHPSTLLSMWGVADTLIKLDRGAEAVPIIDECVQRGTGKVVDPRLLHGVIDLRLRHFERMKDPAGCRQTAEMWERLNRADAASLYTAARMRAVTAAVLRAADSSPTGAEQANGQAEQAMAWLKQAIALGYNHSLHIALDPNLRALRGRDDFWWLLVDLAASATKKK